MTPAETGIRCPGGESIEIGRTVFGTEICTIDIPEQHGLTGIMFTQIDSDTITVEVAIQDQIKYTDTDRSGCPYQKTETYEVGDFVANLVLDGFDDAGHETTSTGTTGYAEGGARNIHLG